MDPLPALCQCSILFTQCDCTACQRWSQITPCNVKRMWLQEKVTLNVDIACTWPYDLWTLDIRPGNSCYFDHHNYTRGRVCPLHYSITRICGGKIAWPLMLALQFWHNFVFKPYRAKVTPVKGRKSKAGLRIQTDLVCWITVVSVHLTLLFLTRWNNCVINCDKKCD